MIQSVQNTAPTDLILPAAHEGSPKEAGFKAELDKATASQSSAEPKTASPEKDKSPLEGPELKRSDKNDHSKLAEEKDSESTQKTAAQFDPLAIAQVPVAIPSAPIAAPRDVAKNPSELEPVADLASPGSTSVPVVQVSASPKSDAKQVAFAVPTQPESPEDVPAKSEPISAPKLEKGEAKISDATQPLASLPADSKPAETEKPSTDAAKPAQAKESANSAEALKQSVNEFKKLPDEVVARPVQHQTNSGDPKPVVESPKVPASAQSHTSADPSASVNPAPVSNVLDLTKQVPDPGQQATPAVLASAVAQSPSKPIQDSPEPVTQSSKGTKPHPIQSSDATATTSAQTAVENAPVVAATANADNKNDASSTKSSAQEAFKVETHKAESSFDAQAGALAAARQTISHDTRNNLNSDVRPQNSLQGTPVPAARQFEAAAPVVNSAQLMQTLNGSEMRVGLHSAEFGNIAIHTAIEHGSISADISVEHSSLGKAVADQLPALQSKLHDEQGIRTQINIQDHSAGLSSDARQQQSQEYQQPRLPQAFKNAFPSERVTSSTQVPATPATTVNGRLSIRI